MRGARLQCSRNALDAAVALLLTIAWLAGCGSPDNAQPTPNTNAPTVLVPFTPDAPQLELPTLLPTVTVPPTSASPTPVVIVVTATPTEPPTATNTRAAVRPTGVRATVPPAATATPLPEGAPRVLVIRLSVDPPTPKADVPGVFAVTFQNLTGENQGYNWGVEIWSEDKPRNPFGETAWQNSTVPPGTSTLTATGWAPRGQGECRPYRARVVARDDEDNRMPFVRADGTILWLDFTVCP